MALAPVAKKLLILAQETIEQISVGSGFTAEEIGRSISFDINEIATVLTVKKGRLKSLQYWILLDIKSYYSPKNEPIPSRDQWITEIRKLADLRFASLSCSEILGQLNADDKQMAKATIYRTFLSTLLKEILKLGADEAPSNKEIANEFEAEWAKPRALEQKRQVAEWAPLSASPEKEKFVLDQSTVELITALRSSAESLAPALSILEGNVAHFQNKSLSYIFGALISSAICRCAATENPTQTQLELIKAIFSEFEIIDGELEDEMYVSFFSEDPPQSIGTPPMLVDLMIQIDAQVGSNFSSIALKTYYSLAQHMLSAASDLNLEQADFLKNILKSTMGSLSETKAPSERSIAELELTKTLTVPEILTELDSLIGLANVKADVKELVNFLKIQKLRADKGLATAPVSRHLVFYGNPGTGKTTVARLLAQIYRSMGLLTTGQLVEAERSKLVAGYVGQTAMKVVDIVEKAKGGVLFIDEVYALCSDDRDPFGQEAIDTLLKLMEDHRDNLIVIVAGYPEKMSKFLNSNPGLRSRFNKYFSFQDYSPEELSLIFHGFCMKAGLTLNETGKAELKQLLESMHSQKDEKFGNGRDVRNLFEKCISNQANRLVLMPEIDDLSLQELTEDDLPKDIAEFSLR